MAQVPSHFRQTRHNADVPDPDPARGAVKGEHLAQRKHSAGGGHGRRASCSGYECGLSGTQIEA